MDLFEEFLHNKKKYKWVELALTDSSVKTAENKLEDKDINLNLATVGDAIIRHCYTLILFEKTREPQITNARKEYESDKFLASKVAKKYKMLEHISFGKNRKEKYKNYNCSESPRAHKYLATAVEAMLGAIYMETRSMEDLSKLLESWMSLSPQEIHWKL